jgi:hypothetical protein
MKKSFFTLSLVMMLTMSLMAQNEVSRDTLTNDGWKVGCDTSLYGGYRDGRNAYQMIVHGDSIVIGGIGYQIAYSKVTRRKAVLLLLDGRNDMFLDLTFTNRSFPGRWISAVMTSPKMPGDRYIPEPRYWELYKTTLHWMGWK